MDKIKTVVFGMIALVACLGLVGVIVLIALDRPITALVSVFVPLITTLGVLGGLGYGQVKQGETLTNVAKNVNGNTTRMLDAIDKLLAERNAAPVDLRSPVETAPPIADDTLARIRAENDRLPAHAAGVTPDPS